MLRQPVMGLFIFAGLAMFLSAAANGQPGENQKVDPAPTTEVTQDVRIDVKFPGGTIEDFVTHLRQISPSANVLVTEQAGSIMLPAIEIKNITLPYVLDAVELLTSRQPNSLAIETIADDSTRQLTWIINTEELNEPLEIVVNVVNASDALDSFQNDSAAAKLMETIDEGLATVFGKTSPPLSIKLHAETGLLFVKGREDKVGFVLEIIGELEKNKPPGIEALLGSGLGGGGPVPGGGRLGGGAPDPGKTGGRGRK